MKKTISLLTNLLLASTLFWAVPSVNAEIVGGQEIVKDAADAAQALRPLAGEYAYLLFAGGLFNASLFAASILPISTAYAVCEGLGLESGLDKTFAEAPIFYWLYTALIVAGAAVLLLAAFPARVRDGAVSSREWYGAAVRADLHVAPDE